MPQPIQGPTLADIAAGVGRREKDIKSKGKVSKRGQAQLKKLGQTVSMAGATKKDLARQRAISKQMRKMHMDKNSRGNMRDPTGYNKLFRESGRIAKKARAAQAAKNAAAVKKASKAKAAKKAAKKAVKKTRPAKKAVKKTRPAKKVAKKVAKKAAPVKKAAKKRR